MDKFTHFLEINDLYAVYGSLLTVTQQHIMEAYYVYNLSLLEIAGNLHISKQAVSDALKVASAKLVDYEEKVGMLAYKAKVNKTVDELLSKELSEKIKAILIKLREDH